MAGSHGIFHAVHRTGIPWDNGYCESFNSKLRNEFLNGEVFYSLKEAQVLAERWRFYYNTERPLSLAHGNWKLLLGMEKWKATHRFPLFPRPRLRLPDNSSIVRYTKHSLWYKLPGRPPKS